MSMPPLQQIPKRPPAGFLALGDFFLFGFVMSSYAAVTLAIPGTILDRGWQLNPIAHLQTHGVKMSPIHSSSRNRDNGEVGWQFVHSWSPESSEAAANAVR